MKFFYSNLPAKQLKLLKKKRKKVLGVVAPHYLLTSGVVLTRTSLGQKRTVTSDPLSNADLFNSLNIDLKSFKAPVYSSIFGVEISMDINKM